MKNKIINFLKNKKIFIILFLLIFLLILFLLVDNFFKKNENKVLVNEIFINLELAENSFEHYLGLSNRNFLDKNSAMLFLFPEKNIRSFVMRDMKFSIDIVFIDENIISDIYERLPFEKEYQNISYSSSIPVNKVLEFNAGFCEENNLKVGQELKFFLK